MVQLVRVVQVVQVSRWSAFMICIQKIVLSVVCRWSMVIVYHLLLFFVCRSLSFVSLNVICHCLLFVVVCCLSGVQVVQVVQVVNVVQVVRVAWVVRVV